MKHLLYATTLFPLIFTSPLNAAPKGGATQVIGQAEKAQASDYALVLLMPQTTIDTSFDTGRVAAAQGGGLLDSLIIHSMDNKKQIIADSLMEKAERTMTPLRMALAGFNVDALAIASSEKALAAVPWIARGSTTLSKTSLPAPTSPRVAQIRYSYDMSPDFSTLRVFAEINFLRESPAKGGKSSSKYAGFYAQSITSIVQLRKRSYEASENVTVWSAEDGKQAKAAFTHAFGQIEGLLPFALELSEADIKAYATKGREQGFAAGYNGPLIKRGRNAADDVLIWNKGLLYVHTLP